MTAALVAKLRGLMEKATPGPWVAHGWFYPGMIKGDVFAKDSATADEATPICRVVAPTPKNASRKSPLCELHAIADRNSHESAVQANAALIVAAINALPALLALAEDAARLRAALEPFADIGIGTNPDYAPPVRLRRDVIVAARAALAPKDLAP